MGQVLGLSAVKVQRPVTGNLEFDMKNANPSLAELLNMGWNCISAPPAGASDFANVVTLATSSPAGAQARSVVIRTADARTRQVCIHTDPATPKLAEIAQDPRVTLLCWSPTNRVQLRLRGLAKRDDPAATLSAWNAIADTNRRNYGVTPPPGHTIAAAQDYARLPEPDRFAVIRIKALEIDVIRLGRPDDIRGHFVVGDGWRGRWIAP